MTTAFFLKKSIYTGLFAALFVAVCGLIGYTASLTRTMTISVEKDFYYLVSESEHVEASVCFAVSSGGAGYVLETDDRQYAALSVYLSETDAFTVQATVEDTCVKKRSARCLYLRKRRDKNAASYIRGGFQTLYGWLTVLEGEINRLSGGCTQQSCWHTLNGLRKQMRYAAKANETYFPAFAKVCDSGAVVLENLTQNIIYAKDLRYLLCSLCEEYCRLSENFAV